MITILNENDYQLQTCRSFLGYFVNKLKFPFRNLAIKEISKCGYSRNVF